MCRTRSNRTRWRRTRSSRTRSRRTRSRRTRSNGRSEFCRRALVRFDARCALSNRYLVVGCGGGAEAVEGAGEVGGDGGGFAGFDLAALLHVVELVVPKDADGQRVPTIAGAE